MGKAIRASLLVLLFACSAQAGYMPNESPTPPPPATWPNEPPTELQPWGTVEETTTKGWLGNEAAASLTQVALDLFAVLPSLL